MSSRQIINIVGAGTYGVFLAYQINKLAKQSNIDVDINLHERGPSIIPGWKSVSIAGIPLNNGFHGLEMPRAFESYQILQELVGEEFFVRFKNRKLCCIEKNLINFRAPISSLPEWCSRDFLSLLPSDSTLSSPLAFSSVPPSFFDTDVGSSFKSSSVRYSDNLERSWGQFYPWFFPLEFPSNQHDEGWVFRDSFGKNDFHPYYLSTKSFLFEDIIEPIRKALVAEGVSIYLNSSFSLPTDEPCFAANSSKNVWAASSAILLKSFSESEASRLYQDKRSFILTLFEVKPPYDSSISVLDEDGSLPSEVIVSSSEVPGVSRISFPGVLESKHLGTHGAKIMVEYYSKGLVPEEGKINTIKLFLESILSVPISFIGYKLGRTIFNPTPYEISLAESRLAEHLNSSPWIVPSNYWWPINIAKCGSLALKSARSILNSL